MHKKYLYIIILSFLLAIPGNAQKRSSTGSKKQGTMFGKNNSNNNNGGPFGGAYSKSGGSSFGSGSASYSKSGSKGNAAGSSSSHSKSSSGSSDQSGLGNSAGKSSGGSSAKGTSLSKGKDKKSTHTYPGISKSKTIGPVQSSNRYSYPGIHSMRNGSGRVKKQSGIGRNHEVSHIR